MLKRIRYVSRQLKSMTDEEVDELVADAAKANAKREITGALVVAGQVFFQVIEGPPEAIDALYAKIRKDERHTNVVCLDDRKDREIRLFPRWSMRRAGRESGAATSKLKTLVRDLASADDAERARLTDQIASLMRDMLRAA